MSQFSELMEELAAIREQNAWLVSAVRYLLQGGVEAGWQPEAPLEEYVEDELELDEELADPNEHIAVRGTPKRRGCAHVKIVTRNGMVTCTQCGGELGCSHNQTGLVNGKIACLRCGQPMYSSGLIQDRVGPSGNILADPAPPIPRAGSGTREASPNNPGRTPSYAN